MWNGCAHVEAGLGGCQTGVCQGRARTIRRAKNEERLMKKSVLIVDDEASAREALSRLLSSNGYAVRTAGDTQEASRLMAAVAAQVVLLDIDLPHVPGDSFAAFLHIRYPRTQIIFMSGQYDMVEPERFGENAMYFRKPLDVDALLETLESASGGTQPAAHL